MRRSIPGASADSLLLTSTASSSPLAELIVLILTERRDANSCEDDVASTRYVNYKSSALVSPNSCYSPLLYLFID